MMVTLDARLDCEPVPLLVIVLFCKVMPALATFVRLYRTLPAVLLSKTLLLICIVKVLLFAATSIGTLETEVWFLNALLEQATVDVPLRVKETPLTLFKNWLFVKEMVPLLGKVASIA